MKETVLPQYNNAQPHTAHLKLETIIKNSWKCCHTVQTCLSQTTYHLFRILKGHMRGNHYKNDNTVQEATHSWLQGPRIDSTTAEYLSSCSTDRTVWMGLQIL